jgi:hypothetical protein
VAATAVACSSAVGADYGDGDGTAVSTPSIVLPSTPLTVKPATDCTKSTQALAPASEMDGVRLEISTDPTGTSMLLRNTGSLSVIVVPDANFHTRLVAAPYANPTDEPSKSALTAVTSSRNLSTIREVPSYVPPAQVILLPPQWAVCALTDNLKETASVRYLREKMSSAEYFVAKGLAGQLIPRFSADQVKPTLVICARATLNLLKGSPDLSDVELYAEILGTESTCRPRYKALLGGDERATQRIGATVLNQLERTPRLLGNSRVLEASAQP